MQHSGLRSQACIGLSNGAGLELLGGTMEMQMPDLLRALGIERSQMALIIFFAKGIIFGLIAFIAASFPASAANVDNCSRLDELLAAMGASTGAQQQVLAKEVFVSALNCEKSSKALIASAGELGGRQNPLVTVGLAIVNLREAKKSGAPEYYRLGVWPETMLTLLSIGMPSSERDFIYLIAAFQIQVEFLRLQPDSGDLAEQTRSNFIDPMRASLAQKTGLLISAEQAICFVFNDTETTSLFGLEDSELFSCEH